MGSGFFLDASTGLLLTAEHVRRACREKCKEYDSEGAKLVVCPYLGGELDWSHAWEAKVVAHTGSWNPDDKRDLPEPGLAAEMVLDDLVDAALLRPTRELMTGTLVSTPVCIPSTGTPPTPSTGEAITTLRISTAPLKTAQALHALGFPTAGGKMTPTPIQGNYSLDETSPWQAHGKFLKFTGAEILQGHSGGPIVTNSGVCVAWSVRNRSDLPMGGVNHVRPIGEAKACIELALPLFFSWSDILATNAEESAHATAKASAHATVASAAGAAAGAVSGAAAATQAVAGPVFDATDASKKAQQAAIEATAAADAAAAATAKELTRAARVRREVEEQLLADAEQHEATLTAPAESARLPHSPKLSPDNQDARKLFGRDRDVKDLVAKLRNGQSLAKYCLVMGSAGLGKTELVLAAARALVKGGESDVDGGTKARRFSAILFVELRAVFSADQVETCVEDAINELQGVDRSVLADPAQRAKLLSGALLILDNADDPYEKSRKGIGGDEGWFEGKLLANFEGRCCRLLLTIRDETESALFTKRSMRNKDTLRVEPLTQEVGLVMLRDEMDGVELTDAQEASILRVCGARVVSPLALSVVCGVLRYEFSEQLVTESDRASYLADLGEAVSHAGTEFSELQTVMQHSIEKVPAADRAAFLQLHLFPDRFTVGDAAALWALDEEAARKLLLRLKKASLVDYASASPQPYLVLDHLWHFADRYAQDPQCEWLSRTQQAGAIKRLMELGHKTGAANERLLSAARSHAVHLLRVIVDTLRLSHAGDAGNTDPAPVFRSLGVAEEDADGHTDDVGDPPSYFSLSASDDAALFTSLSATDVVPALNQKRKHDAAPEFKGIGAVSAAYEERKVVAGQGPIGRR